MTSLVVGPDRRGNWIAIEQGRIEAVGDRSQSPPSAAEQIVCADRLIEPGRVNAHTHLYSGLMPLGLPPALPEPENFMQVLERFWWKLDRCLDQEMLRASSRFYVAEALLAGTTSIIDHHESPNFIEGSLDVIASACEELGIRAALCYGATERNRGLDELHEGLEECRRFADGEHSPRVRGLVGLHASFTVSDNGVRAAGALCRELATVLHIHVAEDRADLADAKKRGYPGPFERLIDLDALLPGSILAHGVHLDQSEVSAASRQGFWLVQNPRSNRGNRVGHPKFFANASRVALGTDGYPADMLEERTILAEHVEAPEEAMRRFDGSRRLVAERFGRSFELVRGAAADLVTVSDANIQDVIVDGRIVVRGARLVFADEHGIRAEAREQAQRLGAAMQAIS